MTRLYSFFGQDTVCPRLSESDDRREKNWAHENKQEETGPRKRKNLPLSLKSPHLIIIPAHCNFLRSPIHCLDTWNITH